MQSLSQLVVFIIDACYYFCCVQISRLSLIKTLALVIFDWDPHYMQLNKNGGCCAPSLRMFISIQLLSACTTSLAFWQCTNISSGRWWITQLCEWDYYYSRQCKLTLNSIGIVVRVLLDVRIPAVKVCGSGNSCLSSWLISQVSAHSNYSFDILQITLEIIQKTLPVLHQQQLNCSNPFLQNVPAALAQSIIDENSQLKLGFSFEYWKQKVFYWTGACYEKFNGVTY
jgi:hypothetical protein